MRVLGLAATVLAGGAVQASAQSFVDYTPTLGPTFEEHTWTNFTLPAGVSSGTSGNAGQWAGTTTPTNHGIAANDGSTANQFYVPLTPAGLAANPSDTTDFVGGGIYAFFTPTHYAVTSSAPLANTNTLVFQLSLGSGLSGAFGGAPMDFLSAPTLKLTLADNSIVSLAANYSLLEGSTPYTVTQIGLNTTLETLGYQWDLSSVGQAITGYEIDFQTAYHAMVFGADTTASTQSFNTSVLSTVPEPGTAMFGLLLIGGLVTRRYRFQAVAA